MFLVLASLDWVTPEAMAMNLCNLNIEGGPSNATPLQVISHALVACRRVRDLLDAAYGPVDGLIGALKRLGDDPLPRGSYRDLMSVLTEPEHRVRAKLLMHMPNITTKKLTTLLWLEEPFILKELVERLAPDDVARFWTAVRIVNHLSPQMTTDDLIGSIKSLEPGSSLRTWLQNQVRRATEFPVALPGLDKAFVPLTTAEAIRGKALEYRNCLKSQFGEMALGRKCFVEYQPCPVIIELTALSEDRWACFDKMYGPRNARPNSATRCAILQKLRASGILIYAHHAGASRWNSVARWLGVCDYDEEALDDIIDILGVEDLADIDAAPSSVLP
ncbi:hypothetical protein JKG68_28505 [Microvirga aerilata]|uniref:Uncharacterized protein n=1 Tax=Microvirga aerilata TaxID=670292 RepID=A0A937D0L1_9HYPH|nr:hypothetical protein [Microvirga aerilata]MBL0407849.1 hypothetical protein [Microvirga aerilata]